METRFLKTLAAVAKTGSMAGAARAEGITAAAVNQRVRVLEREFKTALFARAGKTVLPTEACLRLLPHARKLVADADQLVNRMDDTGLSGELKIGAIATLMAGLVPDALARLRGSAPGLKPSAYPGTSPVLYGMITRGELDLALVIEPPFPLPKSLKLTHLRTEPLMFLAHKNLHMPIGTALKSQPYIRYDPQSWGGRQAQRYLQDSGITPNIFCTMDDLETTARMVEKGLGVSLVPNWLAANRGDNILRWQPTADTHYDRHLICLTPAVSARQQAIDAFLKHVTPSGQ